MESISQISESDLSAQLSIPLRRVLKTFVKNPDVSSLLCFRSPLTGSPRLVPIGEALDFSNVESAMATYGSTASQILSVDCAAARNRKVEQSHSESGVAELTSMRQVDGNEIAKLRERLNAAEAKAEELARLKELQEGLIEHEENLNSRELALMRMEDELMDRMNRYTEQMAEIEQREENLASREAELSRKVLGR